MDEKLMNITVPELTLLLIFLTGWEEDKKHGMHLPLNIKAGNPKKLFRAWKGYRMEILKELEDQGFIFGIPGGKSVLLTEEGKNKAEELKQKYLI